VEHRIVRATRMAARTIVAAAAIVGLLALLVALSGYDPRAALSALWSGSFGSAYAIFSATLVRATPLVLTGLAVALAFSGGVLNIGAEGQFLAGAAAGSAVALALPPAAGVVALIASLAAGAVVGAAWTIVPAILRVRFRVLEVISTIMMNFIALHAVSYLVRGPLQEPLRIYPQSSAIPAGARLPIVLPGTRLHLGFVLAVLASIAAWLLLRHTAAGFRIRVTGTGPTAARSAGMIDVDRVTLRVFLLSGALAGLAGAVEVSGVTYALYENISPGYGYTAIAVALLGGLHPIAVAGSGIFLGALEAGAASMQRDAAVPSVLVSVVEALVILAVIGLRAARAVAADEHGGTEPRREMPSGATPSPSDA
jgi:general nucleoside transport system permease protein